MYWPVSWFQTLLFSLLSFPFGFVHIYKLMMACFGNQTHCMGVWTHPDDVIISAWYLLSPHMYARGHWLDPDNWNTQCLLCVYITMSYDNIPWLRRKWAQRLAVAEKSHCSNKGHVEQEQENTLKTSIHKNEFQGVYKVVFFYSQTADQLGCMIHLSSYAHVQMEK